MKIGVIDSGKGGELVSKRIKDRCGQEIKTVQYKPETFVSYSNTSLEQLFIKCKTHVDYLHSQNVSIIVVGCMTLSVNCLDFIKSLTDLPVKDVYTPLPRLDKSWTVLATENSIRSGKFSQCVEIPCGTLSGFIESQDLESLSAFEDLFFEDYLEKAMRLFLSSAKEPATDKIVLGCTHYPLIQNELKKILKWTSVIDPINYLLNAI